MKCIAYKPLARGSMLGFADLEMGSGLILRGCAVLEASGKRWVNPPGRPQLDADRKPMLDDHGKVIYAPVVDFTTKAVRSRWSAEAVSAIEPFINSTTPTEAGVVNGRDTTGGEPQKSRLC